MEKRGQTPLSPIPQYLTLSHQHLHACSSCGPARMLCWMNCGAARQRKPISNAIYKQDKWEDTNDVTTFLQEEMHNKHSCLDDGMKVNIDECQTQLDDSPILSFCQTLSRHSCRGLTCGRWQSRRRRCWTQTPLTCLAQACRLKHTEQQLSEFLRYLPADARNFNFFANKNCEAKTRKLKWCDEAN